jgi:hypothetical protein
MRREDLLEFFLGHLAVLGAVLLCRIARGFGWLVLGFLAVFSHGTAPLRVGSAAAATLGRTRMIF